MGFRCFSPVPLPGIIICSARDPCSDDMSICPRGDYSDCLEISCFVWALEFSGSRCLNFCATGLFSYTDDAIILFNFIFTGLHAHQITPSLKCLFRYIIYYDRTIFIRWKYQSNIWASSEVMWEQAVSFMDSLGSWAYACAPGGLLNLGAANWGPSTKKTGNGLSYIRKRA